MYYCEMCGETFEEPAKKRITFEEFYGVSNLFPNGTPTTVQVCPQCNSDDIAELQQCEICQEWYKEEQLQDTTEFINGGCGYCCEQCISDADMIEI